MFCAVLEQCFFFQYGESACPNLARNVSWCTRPSPPLSAVWFGFVPRLHSSSGAPDYDKIAYLLIWESSLLLRSFCEPECACPPPAACCSRRSQKCRALVCACVQSVNIVLAAPPYCYCRGEAKKHVASMLCMWELNSNGVSSFRVKASEPPRRGYILLNR